MRQHRRPKRRRIAARRFFRAAFEPGEQLEVGRRETGPEELDILRIGGAQRRDRGFGEPRRNADAQAAGDELDQRPAAGLVERIEPARELRRQLGLAERGERFDDGSERQFFPPPLWGAGCGGGRVVLRSASTRRCVASRPPPLPSPTRGEGVMASATSARRFRKDRRRNRRTVRTAPDRCVRRSGCG